MVNKRRSSKRQMESLGIRKNEAGNYEYIDTEEKRVTRINVLKKEPK